MHTPWYSASRPVPNDLLLCNKSHQIYLPQTRVTILMDQEFGEGMAAWCWLRVSVLVCSDRRSKKSKVTVPAGCLLWCSSSWLADTWLLTVPSPGLSSGCMWRESDLCVSSGVSFSSYQEASPIGWGPHIMNSFNLNDFLKRLVSKYNHCGDQGFNI